MSVKTTMYVDGMTCSACERRIEKALGNIPEVRSVTASLQGGKVSVEYDEGRTSPDAFKKAIEEAGYTVRRRGNASTLIALWIGVVLVAGYSIASASGVFNALPKVDASLGYGMLFIVGLLTSVHCVAMCGGIALSQSLGPAGIPAKEIQPPSAFARIRPGLLYNLGRLASYTIIGGIVGGIGSAFSFSPYLKGGIAAAAGLFMVVLGLRMLGLLAKLPKVKLLPTAVRAGIAKATGSFRAKGPLAVGFLNGFMPCGPLQTMQLYALGTGSIIGGALSMLVFSAGTIPLMLVFGLAATVLPRRFVPVMVKASAILVMFLGVITVGRAAALAGIALPTIGNAPSIGLVQKAGIDGTLALPVGGPGAGVSGGNSGSSGIAVASLDGDIQTITTEFKDGYYVPFVVKAGVPLRWTIRVTADELNGCNNPVTVPAYGIQKTLVPGDNVIEFTPKQEGTIGYTCWMGMISSRIVAVKDLGDSSAVADAGAAPLLSIPGSGGGCCSGASNPAFAGGKVPVETIGMPKIENGVQVVTVRVDSQGYFPAALVLQKGMKAIIKFDVKELSGCNNPIAFPEYNGQLDLSKGQLQTPEIPVTEDFTFQCYMGMLHGYVKTVDDLAKADIAAIRAEIGAYKASGGGGCCGG